MKIKPILSFDISEFLENNERMNREQILTRLSKKHFILHSMPPVGRGQRKHPICGFDNRLDNIFFYQNPFFLPKVYGNKYVDNYFDILRSFHRKLILKLKSNGAPIVYIWHPFFYKEAFRYKSSKIVYHIYDDYRSGNHDFDNLIMWENILLKKADIVFSSSSLTAKNREVESGREVIHVPNAVDYELYESALAQGNVQPSDMADIPFPRVGYVGRLNNKVDLILLSQIAKSRPSWSLVVVGPLPLLDSDMCDKFNVLFSRQNVFYLGAKDPSELPHYYSSFDVSLLAYKVDKSMWSYQINPLKIYECLATGGHVVAADLPEIRNFSNVVKIATTPEEWIESIAACIDNKPSASLISKRKLLAKENSWDVRIDKIEKYLL